MRIASAALVCLVVAGCGSTVPVPSERPLPTEQPSTALSTPSPSASVEGFKLALLPPEEESPPSPCAGIGTNGGTLQGAEADLHKAWLEEPVVPPIREELVWPAGYRAQFKPELIIVAADGRIFARAGDRVDGLCVTEAGQRFIPLNYRRSPG
jgi:hypothetical protein